MSHRSEVGSAFVAGGAASGAWVSLSVGNMGLAFSGTAVSLGLAPLTAVGALTGAASYGAFRAVLEGDAAAISAATIGSLGGASLSITIGGMGLAFSGTAISLGIAPVSIAGSVVGLAIYGLLKITDGENCQETVAQIFERIEDKVSWQEAYTQALLELSSSSIEQELADLDIDNQLNSLKVELALEQFSQISQQQLKLLVAEVLPGSQTALNFAKLQGVKVEGTTTFFPFSQHKSTKTEIDHNHSDSTQSHVLTYEDKFYSWECVQLLKEHEATITSFAFSSDGKLLASGSNDRTICLYDLNSKKRLFRFVGAAQEVHSVALSSDGQFIAGASFDHKVTVWLLKTKAFLRTFFYKTHNKIHPYTHAGFVYSVVFTPDNNNVITCGDDKVIRIWKVQNGKLVQTFSGHSGSVLTLAISADGQLLASGSSDGTIKVWNLNSGKLVYTLTGSSNWVFSLAITSDSQTLFSGSSDGTIKRWNLKTGDLLSTIKGETVGVFSLAISPDGQILASGSSDNVQLWSLETEEPLQTLSGCSPVAFSPDGETLVCGSDTGTTKLWRRQSVTVDRSDALLSGNWWEILGIEKNSEQSVVKEKFYRLAKKYHPDVNKSSNAVANMQAIITAYGEFRRLTEVERFEEPK